MTETNLKKLRMEIERPTKVTQEMMARDSRITLQTYRNAEAGRKVTWSTAQAVFKTLNAYRKIGGFPVLAEGEIQQIFNLE